MKRCVIGIAQEIIITSKKLDPFVSWLVLKAYNFAFLEPVQVLDSRAHWCYLLLAIQAFLSFAGVFL